MIPTSAILFPGQGSQTPEMRGLVADLRPDLLTQVSEAIGEDPFVRAEESTDFAQPAIFCASLAGWERIGRPPGELMAGHSLGELAALVAAGALSEPDGLALVVLRGRLMQRAGQTAGRGGMIAVMGPGASEQAPDIAAAHDLSVANDNSPLQVTISGARERLAAAVADAKARGLRAMELDVTGAFHSPMMASAVGEFAAALAQVDFRATDATVVSAVTARPFTDPRRELADALINPVRWRETMLTLHELGAERFVDVGPGRVLSGLAKRTLSGVELVNA